MVPPDKSWGLLWARSIPPATEARFKAQKLPMIESNGYHLYAFGSGGGAGDILFLFLSTPILRLSAIVLLSKS